MGIDILVEAIELNQKICEQSIQENNSRKSYIFFMNYLSSLFSLRENLGIMDKEKRQKAHTVFGALKNIYESIKHKTDINEVTKLNIFIYSKKYPYSYPYRYGPAVVVFGEIDKLAEFKEKRSKKEREKMILLHNTFLRGKSVIEIMQHATNETLKEITNGQRNE